MTGDSGLTSSLRVLTQPLGGPPLARAVADEILPAEWLRPRAHSRRQWRTYAEGLRASFSDRDWLGALAPAIEAGGIARERLERSAGGQGIVVTTGQQPGLFGGAMYTWSKAVSALAFADALQDVAGIPVAPVFWAATDDTDYAEASVTHIAVTGGVERLSLPPSATPGATMRDTPLADVSVPLARLARGAGAAVDPEAIDFVRAAYAAGATVGSAYVALLRRILEPLGVAVLDAGHPDVRRAAFPLLAHALRRADTLELAVHGRQAAIRSAGFEPQVAEVPGLSLVFAYGPGGRSRVPVSRAMDVATHAAEGTLGPNVLLRPVVERFLLPTSGYVAGPGELAYFVQVGAVADVLEHPAPIVLPRWSGMVVEPHVQRILDRYGLTSDDVRDPHAIERCLARDGLPSRVRSALARCRETVASALKELEHVVADEAPPLAPTTAIGGVQRVVDWRLERLERRLIAASRRRMSEMTRDVATARAALWPIGKSQERVLNGIPFLARHGPRLLSAMLAEASGHAVALSGRDQEDTLQPAPPHSGDEFMARSSSPRD